MDVKFSIKLLVDGKNQITAVAADVRALSKELSDTDKAAKDLRDNITKFANIGFSFSHVVDGLKQLTGVIGQYSQAAAVQEQVEVQVATVMRQRMNATEEEIQSIKDLASAQQELGIIGDEVQLAGVQQIATFLNEKSSIEALLPAMNDLLVQQHGYNVSAQDAVSVANMMGKVMQGQTSALKRVGITFTAAQEQLLKYGDESQRAATLAQVITDNVGHMNAELAKTDAGKAQQLSNTIGDLKEKIGALFSSIEPAIVAVGELGMAVMGLGQAGAGIKGVITALSKFGRAVKAVTAAQTYCTAVTTTTGTAAAGAAVGVTALGVAIRGLLIATGVGVAIWGLSTIIGGLIDNSREASEEQKRLAQAAESAKASAEACNRAYTDAAAGLKINIARTKDFNGTKEQEKKLVAELNSTYGVTMGYFSSVSAWYNALVANSKAYCRQMVIEAKQRMLANQIAEEERKREKIHDNINNDRYDKTKTRRVVEVGRGTDEYGQEVAVYGSVEGPSELDKANNEAKASWHRQNALERRMEANAKESASLVMPVKGAPVAPTAITTPKVTGRGGGGNTGNTGTDKPEPLKGSIDYYQKELDELRKKIYAAADEATAKTLQATYEEKEAQLKALKIRVGLEEPKKEEAKTYMEQLQERLNEAKKTFDNATTVEARVEANAQVEAIQAEINEATYGRLRIPAEVEPAYIQSGSLADKRASYDNAQAKAGRIQQDYEIGIIGKDEALRQLVELNAVLFQMGLEPVHIEVETEDIDKAKAKFDATTDAIGAMGSSFSGLGDALELPELNVAGTLAQAIATMAQGYATATAQAGGELGPIGWLAFAATGLAQLTAMIQSVKKVTAFAQGGVVSGPTLGLIGEYAGASNNPEVIAPLDKLRSMMPEPGGMGGNVRFEIEGRKLVGVIGNETQVSGKSGRRNKF